MSDKDGQVADAGRSWTDAQSSAIRARRRTLVAAAAGAGKTSVLTERIVQALVTKELDAAQLCAVTFTDKAAQEMRTRVFDRLSILGAFEILEELDQASIGTIHSLCANLLRRYGPAIGVDPNVLVLDEAQHEWIQHEELIRLLARHDDDPDVYWLRTRFTDSMVMSTLRGLYQFAQRHRDIVSIVDSSDVGAILDKSGVPLVDAYSNRRFTDTITYLWDKFSSQIALRKRALGRISFDDLESYANALIKVPKIRTELQARWTMVLVDEFQDTNSRQYEILDAIGADRLFMVGDEWQSIYRFRGADVDVFRKRRQDSSDTSIIQMRENFRSVAPVLHVVNHIFGSEHIFGSRYEPVLPGTEAQKSSSEAAVELLIVPESEQKGRVVEAKRVAERIAQLVKSGEASPSDIAVLYAKGTGAGLYEEAIRAWAIPVLRGASTGFYDHRDVRDVLALLAWTRNHSDNHAALEVIAGPLGQLSWDQLADLTNEASEKNSSLFDVACQKDFLKPLIKVVNELSRLTMQSSLVQVVLHAVSIPSIEVGAAQSDDGLVRVANLRRLVELAHSAEQIGIHDLTGYLEFVRAQGRDARVSEASVADEHAGAVRLMTIHAAKGLEFPHVFVVEATARRGANNRGVLAPLEDEHGRLHLAVAGADGKAIPTPILEDLHLNERSAQAEESLRLWYVAMTRAREKLYISGRWNFTATKSGAPRAVPGALNWIRDALELPKNLGGSGKRFSALEGFVIVDTNFPELEINKVGNLEEKTTSLSQCVDLRLGTDSSCEKDLNLLSLPPAKEFQSSLRSSISQGIHERDLRRRGTHLHSTIATSIQAAVQGASSAKILDEITNSSDSALLRVDAVRLLSSPVFQRLVELKARTEVPFIATGKIASRLLGVRTTGLEETSFKQLDVGRYDAIAQLDADTWWFVDWKTSLPVTRSCALKEHEAQLKRYTDVLFQAGVDYVVCSLVSITDPHTHLWHWRACEGKGLLPTDLP